LELVAQDEAIADTSTAKSPTSEEEVAAPTASDIALVAQSVTVEHTGAQGRDEVRALFNRHILG